ncbi:MAG: arylsulfatase, partial [Actinobacteria bacterium]
MTVRSPWSQHDSRLSSESQPSTRGGGGLTSRRYEFGGTIGQTVETSTPWWPPVVRPPKAAPNVVVVVLDDVGFAQLGCYGSNIATPVMDGLAANGLRYSNFHVTALCSPTRAALLTGRNHHSAGMGLVSNFDNGFPGYRGYLAHETATIAEVLHDYDYANYCVGKWHLAPPRDTGPLGPFDHWPLGRGFDHYYGFLHGRTNQWVPNLWHDNHSIEPPTDAGYHLTEDLVDHALTNLRDWMSANSSRPFFLYLAFGACHDPHHVPEEFIARYAGAFDDGWDVERDRVLARQKEMGVVPASTKLPPANPGVRAWNELDADERRLFARMQEVFAGFLSHTDHHLGRVVDFLTTHGLLDDTLLILLSDNGASMEGGAVGSTNIQGSYRLGTVPTIEDNLEKIDLL